MHKHTIDWLRQIHLTADAALAEKRWETAEKAAEKLPRTRLVELLRLFLFPNPNADFSKQFTDDLVGLDPEYPVTDNAQDLRLMAGLVMVTIFDEPSHEADAFALGIRAGSFPPERAQPVQPAMAAEAEGYLLREAARLRPDDFATGAAKVVQQLVERGKALAEAAVSGDNAREMAANGAFRESIIETISKSHNKLAARLEQLAEESALLWWVLNEHSEWFPQPVRGLTPQIYALTAASEAARRTRIIPPPPCIAPLLARALASCRAGKKEPVLADYIEAADPSWRAAQVKCLSAGDCRDLVPLSTALEKSQELDVESALKALPKLCPGVSGSLPLAPAQAAQQFYKEIVFLRALAETSTD